MFISPQFYRLWSVYISTALVIISWLSGWSSWVDYNHQMAMTRKERQYQRLVVYDLRLQVLTDLFKEYNSPLQGQEAVFISMADKYQIPWTLLPSIAGKESSFGKRVPYYKGKFSYNPFGWGVTGGQVMVFESWAVSIETVAQGLRRKYFDKGLDTIAEIERYYTPPSYYGSRHWQRDVAYLSRRLEADYRLRLAYTSGDIFLGLNQVLTYKPMGHNMEL